MACHGVEVIAHQHTIWQTLAHPKSASFASPLALINMLLGFRSLRVTEGDIRQAKDKNCLQYLWMIPLE